MPTHSEQYNETLASLVQIRDEKAMYANTAKRVGEAMVKLLNYFESGEFLSKVSDDTANGIITFAKGLAMGDVTVDDIVCEEHYDTASKDNQLMTAAAIVKMLRIRDADLADMYLRRDIDDTAKGVITFARGLISQGVAKLEGSGTLVDDNTVFDAVCLYAAGLAIFKTALSSQAFTSGFVGGFGWKLWMEEVPDILGELVKKSHLEIDNLTVRGTMNVYELVVNQIRGCNDNFIFAGQMKVDRVDVDSKKIYLDTQKGETYLPFVEGDILLVQQFGAGGVTLRRYKLIVEDTHMGDIWKEDGTKDENRVDWITWSKFEGNVEDIRQGDVLTRIDHIADPERKGIVTVDSIGNGAPCVSVLYGMETDPEKSLRVRLGKLDGITDPLHGALSGYGLYGNKVYLTGEFKLVTGEDVRTAFIVQENMLASVQTQTTYDITDEDMLLANCSFIGDLDHWTADEVENDGMYSIDGVPLMHDYGILSSFEHTVAVAVLNGKRLLQITDSGITQALAEFQDRIPEDYETTVYVRDENDEIMVDETGMPLTETVTKRRTFYVWLRYQCRRGKANADGSYGKTCSLKVGFLNGKSYKVTGDEGDIVTIPSGATAEGEDPQGDICLVEYTVGVNDESWTDIRFKGYYDGSSDFRIEADGDLLIDNLVVTWHELDEYKHIVSTALLQHDGIIGMYGRNIAKNGKDIVEVGNQVDANKKEWKAWVSGTYEEDKLTIYNAIKINEQGITALASKVDGNSEKISKLEITAGSITQRVAAIEKDYITSGELKMESDEITAAVKEQYDGVASRVSELEITAGSITQRVAAIEGDYITSGELTAESNRILGVVTETYGDVPTRVSKLELTASGLTSTVSALGNPNLFTSTNGEGWYDRLGTSKKELKGSTTDQRVTTRYYGMYSKAVWLIAGTTYCISWWAYTKISSLKYFYNGESDILPNSASESSISSFYTVKDGNGNDVVMVMDDYNNDEQDCKHYYARITPLYTGFYFFNFYYYSYPRDIYYPKIEEGSAPTRYDKSTQSTIQQTSELIRLSAEQVKIDAVGQADINARNIALNAIENATIKAGQITLEGLVTANSNFKILQDGSMEAVNGKFSGELKATSGSITGNLNATGKITFGSTNKLEINGSSANIIGYTGNDVSIRLGYNADTVNGYGGAGLYLYRADEYVSYFRRHDWQIWSYDNYELAGIDASCNGASELMNFYDNGSNRFTFGISATGKFYLCLSNVNMLPTRDDAVKGQLFVGDDEIVRIKLKDT